VPDNQRIRPHCTERSRGIVERLEVYFSLLILL
jgi:hypothetical protein